jgi:hypothetical protein
LTPDKRLQIDQYLKQMQRATKRKPLLRTPSSAATSVVPSSAPAVASEEDDSNMSEMGDDNDEGDDEADFELLYLSGLEEVAKDSMLNQDFAKAETILDKAIQRHTGSGSSSGDADFKHLQIQLAMCYLFQYKWRLAEPWIARIAKSKANRDAVACNLLHALALANLSDYHFEKAITVCKQALHGKRRLKRTLGATYATEYNETLGLLATIYDIKGDPMFAEVLRRTITAGFSYQHPMNGLEFIVKHPTLSQEVFCGKIAFDWGQLGIKARKLNVIAELPGIKMMASIKEKNDGLYKQCKETKKPLQTLSTKLDLYEKFEKDTAKEVVVISIPSPASDGEKAFNAYCTRGLPSYHPEMAPKRSFTRKIALFLGSIRMRPSTSRDGLILPQAPEAEDMPSPLRRKLRKGSWSKSDIFSLTKSKTRLRKKASEENVKR